MERHSGRTLRNRRAVAWNVVGLGVAGSAGIILLLVIAALHGPEALGRFNLLFATYLIGSQVATLGLQVSVVRFVAPLPAGRERTTVFCGAVAAVLASGSGAALLLLLVRGPLVEVLGRPELTDGLVYVAGGILLFSVNKVLLASLTAADLMVPHAALMAARGLLVLGTLALLSIAGTTGEDLIAVLVLSEGSLAVLLVLRSRREFAGRVSPSEVLFWSLRHLRFGLLGAGSTMLAELNIRVDVLVLAFFVDDRAIGVYTLVATLSEAAFQLPLVFRTVRGPGIVKLVEAGDAGGLREELRDLRSRLRLLMAAVAAGVFLTHLVLSTLFGMDRGFREGWVALAILLVGVVIASGYVPFSLILAYGGRPLAQTGFVATLAMLNLVGNLMLVPRFGLVGAAAATALANIASVPLLRIFSARSLGLNL